MKKFFLFTLVCTAIADCMGQYSVPDNNGLNLEDLCEWPECLYANFPGQVTYPDDTIEAASRWMMANFELALKESGYFLLTGDFYSTQDDQGAVFDLEIQFYDYKEEKLGIISTGDQHFYSEPGYAEPFLFEGRVNEDWYDQIDFFGMKILKSEILPYYEIESSCYLPCKNQALRVKLKDFKSQ